MSTVNNIQTNSNNSDNTNKNILNSEIMLKEQNINKSLFDSKKSKIKYFKNRIKLKSEKEKKFSKFKKTLKYKEKNNNMSITYNKKIINFSLTNEDFQDMNYYQAFNLDKRSFIRIYWSYLVDSQIILGTFFTSNFLHLFVIKLSFFISTFQISFFLNALFYTDEYISNAYHNDGVLDILSGLPKSIYSYLSTLITSSLLGMLSNSKNELIYTIKNRTYKINYLLQVNIKLKKLRNKLIIYYILLFILGTFFLYYVSAFCAVYRNSQKYWLIGCLESFIIDFVSSLGFCIFPAIFRYISLKKRIKFFFTLAKIISIFI